MTTPDDKDREEVHEDDVVLNAFLQLLEQDIKENPQNLRRISEEDFERWRKLTEGVEEVDLNDPLPPDED